jgi:hypothetical protein
MRLTDDELKRLYSRQTARSVHGGKECLSEEELLGLATGEVSKAERERMADHLMSCSDCSEEYQLTLSLKPLVDEATTSEKRPQRIRNFPPVRALYAIAASMLIASICLGAWIFYLQREKRETISRLNEQLAEKERAIAAANESLDDARRRLEETPKRNEKYEVQIAELQKSIAELARPQLNVPITDLDPQNSTRSGDDSSAVVSVPPNTNLFTLILNVSGEQSYSRYSIEIADERGKPVWSGSGLRTQSQLNNFTISLSRPMFPAGNYRIRLYGLQNGKRRLVESYFVRIEYR